MPIKILIIGLTWPEPSTTAAGVRMMQLVNCFLKAAYKITFASAAVKTEHSENLEVLGIESVQIYLNHASFDTFIKKLHPQIVVFDRFLTEEQFGWRIARHVPEALRILDTEDLHSLRKTREAALLNKRKFSKTQWIRSDATKREIASIYRSDVSLIISQFEMDLLNDALDISPALLLHLPFMMTSITKKMQDSWTSFENRTDFVFIGNGKHQPNADAINYLASHIWPLIRATIPNAQIHIYGAYMPPKISKLNDSENGFLVEGWAEDIKEALGKARVQLVPLRYGAGIKGKLLESMVYGTPSVATPIAAEGICKDLPWPGSIEKTPIAFTQAAINLYNNKQKWKEAQGRGVELINSCFNQKQIEDRLLSKIQITLKNLEQHRDQNFIGAMLQHHTTASSKYLSRWIEAKAPSNAP